jgi:glycyl-tRNA synthetase beta chain
MLNSTRIVGERSYGHRFSSGPIEIADAAGYAEALRAVGVEPDSEERFKQIAAALDGLGDWTDPHGVLAEVMYLAESPVVLDCSFDERYLQLPSRVVETTIQHHIRAFPLGGNRFAFVANGGDTDTGPRGVENVVGGRLEDASFTFERDVKVGIDALAERLGAITFFHGAGLVRGQDRAARKLVEALAAARRALEAAPPGQGRPGVRARARSFPELEATSARVRRLAGLPEAVCAAIDGGCNLPDARGSASPTPKKKGEEKE